MPLFSPCAMIRAKQGATPRRHEKTRRRHPMAHGTKQLALSLAAALAAHASFAEFDANASGLSLYWRFAEKGATPTAADTTSNGRNGTANGNVKGCGSGSTNVKSYGGFTSNTSYVYINQAKDTESGKWMGRWSFVAWVRNPDLTSTSPHIIARGSLKSNLGNNGANPWCIWIDTEGKVNLAFQVVTDGARTMVEEQKTVNWSDGKWRQVAVVFSQTVASGTYTRTADVYVTQSGADEVNKLFTFTDKSTNSIQGGDNTALLVGAGQKGNNATAAPAGYFAGEIRDVSVWTKNLTAAELLADVKTFKDEWHGIDDFALLHWKMDGSGAKPTATDTAAKADGASAINGVSSGNVVGKPDARPPHFKGFTTTASYVAAEKTVAFPKQFDVLMLVRNPALVAGNKAVLARGSYQDSGLKVPWQAWINENGSIGAGTQDTGTRVSIGEGEAFAWERGKWHLVLIRRDTAVDETSASDVRDRVRVYVAKTGSESLGDPVEALTEAKNSLKTARAISTGEVQFSVGGGETGIRDGNQWNTNKTEVKIPGGYWGGQIADVSFVSGGHYDDAFLLKLLKEWDYKQQGLTVIVR